MLNSMQKRLNNLIHHSQIIFINPSKKQQITFVYQKALIQTFKTIFFNNR